MVQTGGIVYGQDIPNLNDGINAKKYYLMYIDINQACNEKGSSSEVIKDACIKLMLEYGKTMESLFTRNSDLVDIILYSP